MNTKTKALTLLSIVLVALVAGSLFYLQSAKADTTTSVATDSETTLSSVNSTDNSMNDLNGFAARANDDGMEPRFGMGHRGMSRGFGEIWL